MCGLSEADVTERLIALCRSLSASGETASATDRSLTHFLAFDSLKLMQFCAGVEAL